jgi:ribonuclease HII
MSKSADTNKTLIDFYIREGRSTMKNEIQICIDEAGRGPLFGRLYVAAVVLPKDGSFQNAGIRDSKKIHSHKKMAELAKYIMSHARAWHIHFIEHDVIDKINIRQAVLTGMRQCAASIIHSELERNNHVDTIETSLDDFLLLVDGNDFPPFTMIDSDTGELTPISSETIEGGDHLYTGIAAASILAKWARDEYIANLCDQYPELNRRYGIDKNKGYGTKQHLTGILEHGITQWHRQTYQRCSDAAYCPIVYKTINNNDDDT